MCNSEGRGRKHTTLRGVERLDTESDFEFYSKVSLYAIPELLPCKEIIPFINRITYST